MKRIEFIAPVAAMRGNLSGSQTLRYAENDNKLWYAPSDKRNYARNYTPRFIGAKRASDGHVYFGVKTKSASSTGNASKLAMAAMGAAAAYYAALLKDLTYKTRLDALYASYPAGTFKSLRDYVYSQGLYYMFKDKQLQFRLNGITGSGLQPIVLENPYHADSATDAIPAGYPPELIVKFWMWLAIDADGETPITFTVEGIGTGVAFTNLQIGNIQESYNILHLDDMGNGTKVGDLWLLADGEHVPSTHIITDGEVFTTTTEAPA